MIESRTRRWLWLLGLTGLLLLALARSAPAQAAGIEVIDQTHENRFPASMVFTVQARGDTPITQAVLFYQLSPGKGVNRGLPEEFAPGTDVRITVNVETGNRKYIPPGTDVTYWWELKDAAGNTARTEPRKFGYDDPRFKFESIEKDGVTLYYYSVTRQRAEQILDTALASVYRLQREAGVQYNQADHPMKIWVYGSKADMDPALPQSSPTYQERTVTLGVRLTGEVMALLGNHPEVLETVAHEVSHMVIHQAIENPFGQLPSWLDEGLAMYAQGELSRGHQRELDEAKRRDQLLSVRSMAGLVGDPSKVNLFYAEAYSLVDYLVKTFGRDKMQQLLQVYKRGSTDNAALEEVYGFNVEGLEDRWRAWIGARSREARAAATSGPVAVPTLSLFTLPQSSGAIATVAPSPVAAAPREVASPAPAAPTPAPAVEAAAPSLVGLIVIAALAALVVAIGVALITAIRGRRRSI